MSYKIYKYFDAADWEGTDEVPTNLNFKTQLDVRLHPILNWDRGRITRIEYHAAATLDTTGELVGSDLVVSEDFLYTVDSAGFARHRLQTITWYRDDNSVGARKYREKFYNNASARTEGRRRRRNVIDNMSMQVIGMIAATETAGDISQAIALAKTYMDTLELEVSKFIEAGSGELSAAIANNTTTSWLSNPISATATIRLFILGELA